ncbi:DUF1254 domain-containing protein [Microbacterium bovistercoris]|uniref:DUF1254 domain-containing protein n=1 Tax=Microbacterium bovistercoris TaxID=2293570 RepID=A0A371NUU7_9MICO|nr:DUF1254 domain-containing protein [Microbacterium bovistercoris]REJ06070.1 DUF1254 domain-containing protein [Microbacterium bovistercoris]
MERQAPGYNTPIPAQVTTPDVVASRLGELRFADGVPTPQTAQMLFDHLDFIRGVEAFLNCIPAASLEGIRRGVSALAGDSCHRGVIADRLMDSNPLFLTGNTDTVYAIAMLDLERDGATVIEVPPGCGPGTVDDAWFRFVIDLGAPGPDRGQGGTYLIVPPGYDGERPDGWFVAESPGFVHLVILRGFLVDGKPDAAVKLFESGVRIYPFSSRNDPPAMEWTSLSGEVMNTVHANDVTFYEEVAQVIAKEPVGLIDAETRGLLASIGIAKGHPFDPDERMRGILVDAAAVGNGTARSMSFRSRESSFFLYEDRQWVNPFPGGDYRFLRDGGAGGRFLDARTTFFYLATVNTPAMALKMVGKGSQYAAAMVDADGAPLDGARTYRLRLPAEVPAADFWSIVVYDPQTRSELQTGQPLPSRNDKRDSLARNADGSTDIVFGPEEPAALATNWIQTVPGKGWFALLRLYGPLETWFDGSWKPGDVEPL